jgi:hypothetical protein
MEIAQNVANEQVTHMMKQGLQSIRMSSLSIATERTWTTTPSLLMTWQTSREARGTR